jgi:hypothetical protein
VDSGGIRGRIHLGSFRVSLLRLKWTSTAWDSHPLLATVQSGMATCMTIANRTAHCCDIAALQTCTCQRDTNGTAYECCDIAAFETCTCQWDSTHECIHAPPPRDFSGLVKARYTTKLGSACHNQRFVGLWHAPDPCHLFAQKVG